MSVTVNSGGRLNKSDELILAYWQAREAEWEACAAGLPDTDYLGLWHATNNAFAAILRRGEELARWEVS